MTLKAHIDDIRKGLKDEIFINEAAVCDNIVRRLLDALGWPKYEPDVVIREYGVEGTRVDFALCHPPLKPLVFIEVKQVGNIEGGEKQLFQYAFHKGVPIAILTDGQKWRFFHPTAQGDYRERKVHELDLIQGKNEESAKCLNRYLYYESIRMGKAVRAIEEDYRNASQQREIEARLPEVWSKLVEEKNEDLILAVMEKAKNIVGHEPTEEQILTFLKKLSIHSPPPTPLKPVAVTSLTTESEKSFTVKGIKRTVNTAQIKEMQAKYNETGVLKNSTQLLVDWKIIKLSEKNAAWSFVKRITGHVSHSKESN
jgi:predicted type IV restriction endonuclease